VADRSHQPQYPRRVGHSALGNEPVEARAVDVLHGHVERAVVQVTGVVHGDDAGMVQPRGVGRLALEPLPRIGIVGQALDEHLDRGGAVEFDGPTKIADALPAGTERADHFVVADSLARGVHSYTIPHWGARTIGRSAGSV